jgi:hypothetical protein
MTLDSILTLGHAADPMLETDSVEGRAARAEATLQAALRRLATLEVELAAIDTALRAEHAPHSLTRMGRIRWLADQARSRPAEPGQTT